MTQYSQLLDNIGQQLDAIAARFQQIDTGG